MELPLLVRAQENSAPFLLTTAPGIDHAAPVSIPLTPGRKPLPGEHLAVKKGFGR